MDFGKGGQAKISRVVILNMNKKVSMVQIYLEDYFYDCGIEYKTSHSCLIYLENCICYECLFDNIVFQRIFLGI